MSRSLRDDSTSYGLSSIASKRSIIVVVGALVISVIYLVHWIAFLLRLVVHSPPCFVLGRVGDRSNSRDPFLIYIFSLGSSVLTGYVSSKVRKE
jgi:hypothetical protein